MSKHDQPPVSDTAGEALRQTVEALLSDGDPDVVRVREGGGPEDLAASLAVTMAKTRKNRAAPPAPASGAAEGLTAEAVYAWIDECNAGIVAGTPRIRVTPQEVDALVALARRSSTDGQGEADAWSVQDQETGALLYEWTCRTKEQAQEIADDYGGLTVVPLFARARQGEPPAGVKGECADCGHPQSEHHYNGACYGICGQFRP